MKKYINVLLKENTGTNNIETLRNLIKGAEFVLELDDGRLTRKEQEILKVVGRNTMISLYCDAIKEFINQYNM